MGANDLLVMSPWCRLQIRMSLLILRLGSELGLSPVSRSTLASKLAMAAGTDFAMSGQRQPNRLQQYLDAKPDKLPKPDEEPN